MRLIMCADPLRGEAVDPAFAAEYEAARAAGLDVALASYEALVDEGDGQVAGLPPCMEPEAFYHTLADRLRSSDATAHADGASGAASGQ